MTSGRPNPYLPNVKSRISTPPLTGRKIFAIETVLSGELVEGPIYPRGRSQSHIFCESRFSILNQIQWISYLSNVIYRSKKMKNTI